MINYEELPLSQESAGVRRALEAVSARTRATVGGDLPTQADVVLNHGIVSTVIETVPSRMRGPYGECFTNALRCSIRWNQPGDWSYCEGYAYHSGHDILFEHAWLCNAQGIALETTCEDITGVVYLGVRFPIVTVAQAMSAVAGSMLFGDYARGFRLIRSHEACCA